MADFLTLLEKAGPLIAAAVVIVVALWRECGQLETRCFNLYERLIQGEKNNTATSLRFLQTQAPKGPDLVAKYLENVERRVQDVQSRIDSLKPPPARMLLRSRVYVPSVPYCS